MNGDVATPDVEGPSPEGSDVGVVTVWLMFGASRSSVGVVPETLIRNRAIGFGTANVGVEARDVLMPGSDAVATTSI